jgi:hypothetical protein
MSRGYELTQWYAFCGRKRATSSLRARSTQPVSGDPDPIVSSVLDVNGASCHGNVGHRASALRAR